MKLITLGAPSGGEIYACKKCDEKMNAGKIVMRDTNGEQFCVTSRGLAEIRGATCDCCAAIRDGSVIDNSQKGVK